MVDVVMEAVMLVVAVGVGESGMVKNAFRTSAMVAESRRRVGEGVEEA